jgi:hypothetical protein
VYLLCIERFVLFAALVAKFYESQLSCFRAAASANYDTNSSIEIYGTTRLQINPGHRNLSKISKEVCVGYVLIPTVDTNAKKSAKAASTPTLSSSFALHNS